MWIRRHPAPAPAALFALLALLVALVAAPHARAGDPAKTVLVLLPDDPTTPAMTQVTAGLRAALDGGWRAPVAVSLEPLGLGWFDGPGYEDEMLSFYRTKYRRFRPDALVTLRSDGIRFVLRLRAELWPGVPLIVLSDSREGAERLRAEPEVTGVWVQWEVRRTVEAALQILPGTRRVALVMGAAPWERATRRRVDEELAPLAGRFELVDLAGLPFSEIQRRVASLPPDSVVYFQSLAVDGAGQRFIGVRAFEELNAASPRPVFTVHGVGLDHGITGGALVLYDRVGRDLGRLALRVLGGERASAIPIRAAEGTALAFDARELSRHGIPEGRLPPGSEVHFRQPTVWDRYRIHIAAALALLLLQAALIGVLFAERRRRARAQAAGERAERAARDALGQVSHLNRVAAMGELGSSIAHELNQPLAAILHNAQAAQRILAQSPPDLVEVRAALSDIVADDKRAGEVIKRMRRLLKRGEQPVERCDLGAVAREVAKLVASDALIREVEIAVEIAAALPPVRGDAVQLQQVALNLLTNALDAVAPQPRGARRITLRVTDGGGQVDLAVEDTGPGVAVADLGRIFEPFFTTKPEGLGMGLSICRSIAESHGGRLSAERRPEGGTAVKLSLPADR